MHKFTQINPSPEFLTKQILNLKHVPLVTLSSCQWKQILSKSNTFEFCLFRMYRLHFMSKIKSLLGKGKMLAATLRRAANITSEEGRLVTSGSPCP